MSKQAVLLINLGSPDSTEVKDVRRYLREFLSDPRVIDAPAPVRALVLNLFILPFRPKKSAEAYSSIWTEQGSPLMVTSYRQQQLVDERVTIPVALAMRYGKPSIPDVLAELVSQGIDDLFVMPLYPHYAMSSYETVVVRVMEVVKHLKPEMRVEMLQPFYRDEDYIDALVANTAPHLEQPFDRILFSFHGIPERHLRKSDPSHAHCLCTPDCCNNPNPAHATCYRHQCFATVKAVVDRLGLSAEQYGVAFQSRLGRDPWLQPYTDETLEQWAHDGLKKVLVICPAFVTDCLETLEEIAEEGKEEFVAAGGEDLKLIPCLNEHPAWIQFLVSRIERWHAQRNATVAPR
ncbi:MAG: ferrochelatase [Verrucomicrobia bacterium]|nr:ferrochelatase [Verrucomicrobiota bacterium]